MEFKIITTIIVCISLFFGGTINTFSTDNISPNYQYEYINTTSVS